MKYQIKLAKRVRKRFGKLNTKEQDIFEYVVNKLANDETLEPKYKEPRTKRKLYRF